MILAIALVVLSCMTISVYAVLTRSVSNVNSIRLEQISRQSESLAESACEVMIASLNAQPATATSANPITLELGGMHAAAVARLDLSTGTWTIEGSSGAIIVRETVERDAETGRLRRTSWAAGLSAGVESRAGVAAPARLHLQRRGLELELSRHQPNDAAEHGHDRSRPDDARRSTRGPSPSHTCGRSISDPTASTDPQRNPRAASPFRSDSTAQRRRGRAGREIGLRGSLDVAPLKKTLRLAADSEYLADAVPDDLSGVELGGRVAGGVPAAGAGLELDDAGVADLGRARGWHE